MAQSRGRLGVAAVVAVMLAGCADARMSDSGSAPVTTGPYGIASDAGSHGSVYSLLFGSNGTKANQSVADARAATPASSPTAGPARPTAASATSSPTVAPSQQAALAAAVPTTAGATPPTPGAYGIPSDAGSHGSAYSYFFGQNGKPAEATSGPPVPVTSYGIPADAGSHGSLYSLMFGSKDAAATPPNGSAATPTAPAPSR
jgi:hypothetical protein